MIVVGGSYLERTVIPSTAALWGSGLKAASALASFSQDVHLITSVSAGERAELQLVARTFGVSVEVIERSARIAFEYYTPVSKPTISGLQQPTLQIHAEGDDVLAFGMLEAVTDIRARTLVFDPQSPAQSPIPDGLRRSCERLAIVLNRHEARRSSKRSGIEAAARSILNRTAADLVVVKCGAVGAFVAEAARRPFWVPAFETTHVWPIGSGDVFTAAFAWHWAARGQSVRESARAASLATAWWSATHQLPLPKRLRIDGRFVLRALPPQTPRVYIAGPFFGVQEEWLVDSVRDALRDLGVEVFSPLHEIGRGDEGVAEKDLRGLRGCSAVLALLDRCDVGTIFEVGYAIAKGIPVVGFTDNPNSDALKMLRGSGIAVVPDLSTAVYRAAWAGM
jgi:hypothetical protein